MNLIEADRLVRAIVEVMERRAPEARGRQLAQDYADACHAVAHRLEQCAAMLDQGNDPQALQLADAPPPLLDLVTRLAFRQSNEWRTFCQANGYAVAETLDGKFVRQLSDAYGKGLSPNHQLFSEYREAVMRHQDEQAVAVLRTIVRRTPLDTGSVRELERLEKKILTARMEQLASALVSDDEARIVALSEEIDALGFQIAPSGETWQRAQVVRCKALLRQSGDLRKRGDWERAATLLGLVSALISEHGLQLPADQESLRRTLEDWVDATQKDRQEDARFQRTLLELRKNLDLWEEKQISGQLLSRGELRARLDALDHIWREVEQFSRPVSGDFTDRAHKALELMTAQLERRNRRLRVLVSIGIGLFALVATVIGVQLFHSQTARDYAAQLRTARERRQVGTAEKLAHYILSQRPGLAKSPSLWMELTATSGFLTNEYLLRSRCETNLAWLQGLSARSFAGISPAQVEVRLKEARKEAETVAEDLRPPLHQSLAALDRQWEEWLGQHREKALHEIRRRLPELEQRVATDLRLESGPDAIRASLQALQPAFTPFQALAVPPLPQLRFPPDVEHRAAQVQKRFADVRGELEKWDQVHDAWRRLPSVEAYLESLRVFRKSEFAAPAQVAQANELLSLNISSTNLLAALLLPGHPEAWDAFIQNPMGRFMPADVLPIERGKLKLLLDDQNIHYIRAYRLTKRGLFLKEVQQIKTNYVRGELTRRDRRSHPRAEQVYDPVLSPGVLTFGPAEYDAGLYGIDDLGRTRERDAFERVRLKTLVDQDGVKYLEPLLGILDAINREQEASPLFRALLAVRLSEVIALRPVDWGAFWAPALAADHQHLQELGAASIQSGEWMCPDRVRSLGAALDAHFQNAQKVSYTQQARFQYELARRTMAAGVSLVGRADSTGKPMLAAAPADQAELWGWSSNGRKPALLFRYHAPGKTYTQLNPAMPLTPLFVLRADRRQLLNETTQAISNRPSELGTYLPPLFAAPYE